jgi:hypothetical protein
LDENVIYAQEKDGSDFLMPGKSGNIDLEVAKGRKMLGADLKERTG